jgi:hypothetical protein
VNAKTIRERFERETGDRLTMHRIKMRGLANFETLDAGKLESKHGRFTIGVFPDAARARRERLLREPAERDEHGVGWEQGEEGWIATKVYDGGVQLQWFADERTLDERWQLLDRVLAGR